MARDAASQRMYVASGRVHSPDPLVAIMYHGIRDLYPAGEFEQLIDEALRTPNAVGYVVDRILRRMGRERARRVVASAFECSPSNLCTYSNGWVARHAIDAARRLRRGA